MKLCPHCQKRPVTGKASNYCNPCIKILTRIHFKARPQDYITEDVPPSVYRERRSGWKH